MYFIGWATDPGQAWMSMDYVTAELYNVKTQTPLAGRQHSLGGLAVVVRERYRPSAGLHGLSGFRPGYDQAGNQVGSAITSANPGVTINSAFGTPDGEHIVVSYWDGTRLYDADTGVQTDAPDLPVISSIISQNGIAAGTTADGGSICSIRTLSRSLPSCRPATATRSRCLQRRRFATGGWQHHRR